MRLPVEPTQYGWHYLSSVIAGLDPAIHLLRKTPLAKRMDPRVKPAGDTGEWMSAVSIPPGPALVDQPELGLSREGERLLPLKIRENIACNL
jgi:hypothetical protein